MSNTVTVSCRNENKLYNAYNLVKAFYPYADVQGVSCEDQPAQILVHVPGSHDIEADDIRSLYCLLRDACKKDLPWGMLTGVRPVKLAFGWIDRNMQDFESAKAAKEAFSDWFYEDRFVSSPKARLAFEIALREREVLERTFGTQAHPEGRSIYISIPFCPSVCSYCSFSSGSIASYGSRADVYLDALICEM